MTIQEKFQKALSEKAKKKSAKTKTKKSKIVSILDEYEDMTTERANCKYLLEDDDWKSDKKWISNRIVDAGLLDRDAIKRLWRSFEFVMDDLKEHDWDKQKELIEFLFNWVSCD